MFEDLTSLRDQIPEVEGSHRVLTQKRGFMKSVILFSSIIAVVGTSFGANLPSNCVDLAAQVKASVISTDIVDLDGNQSYCSFKVQVDFGTSSVDQYCPIDLGELEEATFVDNNCSVKIGQEFNHTTNQYFNTKDMTSRGLFYWFNLGGYSSEIVFPNYGK